MIAAGEYDWVHPSIPAKRFPAEGEGSKQYRIKIFNFGHDISSKDAVVAMKKEGFVPANHVEGLAFGASFPKEQLKYPIACLGSSAQVVGARGVLCLDRGDGERGLRLDDWHGHWGGRWRFLGVREVSAA